MLLFILLPVRTLVAGLPLFGTAEMAVRRLGEVGEELGREDEGGEALIPSWDRLELAGVEHTYRDGTGEEGFRLGPVDLVLRRGEVTFLIGGNGSGKTTLAKLIAGLYAPEVGELRLDGRPVAGLEREAWRGMISAVFWDFFLFESLRGTEEEAGRLLTRLGLDGKVGVLDGRLSTTTALSTGQRRRLALLAAWLEDRPVCLFDEWAADQEPAFREVFYREAPAGSSRPAARPSSWSPMTTATSPWPTASSRWPTAAWWLIPTLDPFPGKGSSPMVDPTPKNPSRGLILALVLLAAVLALALERRQPPDPKPTDAPAAEVSGGRARDVLRGLLGDGSPHPTGSAANVHVRDRIVDRLRALGYAPEIQQGFACNDYSGDCARVQNVIARLEELKAAARCW